MHLSAFLFECTSYIVSIQVKQVRNDNDLEKKSKGKTLEGVDDPLTNGDLQSHQAMMEAFHQSFPRIKVRCPTRNQILDCVTALQRHLIIHKPSHLSDNII